ncbi:MAG: HDOD domain-containing protein [Desulforegulaceae bacterium]|nr:HDOD domain-containing protein [Desulforegulaceae bacterium]
MNHTEKTVKIISLIKSDKEKAEIEDFLNSKNIFGFFTDSSEELIQLASKTDFSIIFVDSKTDQISIKELPEKINSSKTNFKAIFSILLNKDNSNLIPEFKKYGYENFLIKPLDKNLFLSTLDTLLKLSKAETMVAKTIKHIKSERKKILDIKDISQDTLIEWGRLETIGKLTSGIMHEIATPVQYIADNMSFLNKSLPIIFESLTSFSKFIESAKKGKINEKTIYDAEKSAKKQDLDYLKDEVPQALKQSIDGIEKITAILLSIRNISRQVVHQAVSSDINKIIENAVTITKSKWKNSAELETSFKNNLPLIKCQPGEISQVIINLIINAVHAIEENTERKNHLIKIKTSLENNLLKIKVSDSGKGIPKNIINKIFNPFFTTKKINKGTGQGLSISKAIIERHNGKLSVSSNPEFGTVFTITLPAITETQKSEPKKESKSLLMKSKPDEKPLIFFVDEDKNILKSLQRMLKSNENQWDLHFFDSTKTALEFMEKKPADIIITEYKMKEINGNEFLKEIKKRFPHTDRVLLSGETDEKKIMTAVPIAHQFIYKPVSGSKLKSMIKRTIAMKSILKNKSLRTTISKLDSLPSLPSKYNEIVRELNSPISSTKKTGEIISTDPSMTSKILQLINSGFFYLPRKISRVDEAVVLLGIDIVKSLVLNHEIFSKLKLEKHFLNFQKELHFHSMATAKTAKEIAIMEGLSDYSADQAFMAGLIHDCGKLVLASNFPEEYKQALENIENKNSDFIKEERLIFNSSHEIIGAFLMGAWGLPLEIIEAILYHHNPSMSSDKEFGVTGAVHAANIIECQRAKTLKLPYEEAFAHRFLERIKIYNRPEIWKEKFLS